MIFLAYCKRSGVSIEAKVIWYPNKSSGPLLSPILALRLAMLSSTTLLGTYPKMEIKLSIWSLWLDLIQIQLRVYSMGIRFSEFIFRIRLHVNWNFIFDFFKSQDDFHPRVVKRYEAIIEENEDGHSPRRNANSRSLKDVSLKIIAGLKVFYFIFLYALSCTK